MLATIPIWCKLNEAPRPELRREKTQGLTSVAVRDCQPLIGLAFLGAKALQLLPHARASKLLQGAHSVQLRDGLSHLRLLDLVGAAPSLSTLLLLSTLIQEL
jgi:hypothetical protein